MRDSQAVCFMAILYLLTLQNSTAQITDERSRTKNLTFEGDTIKIDSLSIIPGTLSIFLNNDQISEDCYFLDFANAQIVFLSSENCATYTGSTLSFSYRVFPLNFSRVFKNEELKTRIISDDEKIEQVYLEFSRSRQATQNSSFLLPDGLEKNGNISRGIVVGNNQSLAVNSAFNLQLSGDIGNGITLDAAISDDNIPIQPDGNTLQLQDFDQVYIRLSKDRTSVLAGDFFFNRPNSYFLNMFKRAQGLSVETAFENKEIFGENFKAKGEMRVRASGAIARGKFARNDFNGVEGNQGPYRLVGNDGENFIVVLSGSEKVYIDGNLLLRGQENDYVIDYNTAQITFTPKRLIFKDIRIVVEFEYSDRNFVRTMYHINNEWDVGKFSYRFNIFSEQDARNQPLQQNLDDDARELLAQLGDNIENAVIPGNTLVPFNPDEVLYAQKDTVVNGQTFKIFIFSVNPDSARFRVTFSPVGQGLGNYVLVNSTANGRVFEWIAPNPDGTLNGTHEPVIRVITPKLQRMITLGTEYRFSENWSIDTEAAVSTFDQNTFSTLDAFDNNGYALRVNLNNQTQFKKSTLKSRVWYEQVNKYFQPVIRFRNVEFGRDWNLAKLEPGNEYLPGFDTEWTKKGLGNVQFSTNAFFKENIYNAWRSQLRSNISQKGWILNTWVSYTRSESIINRSDFARHRTQLSKQIKMVRMGFVSEDERNLFFQPHSDTLLGSSYMFNDWKFFIASADTAKLGWEVFYRFRADHLPTQDRLSFAAIGEFWGLSINYLTNPKHQIKTTFAYRKLSVRDTSIFNQSEDESLVSRIEYTGRFAKSNIVFSTFYEVGSGLENKREFSYIPVVNGQGTHFWDETLDFNGNGVPDLDEFQVAQFPGQGNYLKVLFATNDFVRTFNNQFNQSLNIKTPTKWRERGFWFKTLNKFQNQWVYRVIRKTQNDNIINSYNPFFGNALDPELISLNEQLRNTLYFNKNQGKFGFDFNTIVNNNRVLFTNGFESRLNRSNSIRSRWNLSEQFTVNFDTERGIRKNQSEFLRNREFDIQFYTIEPRLTFQPNANFRASIYFNFEERLNVGDTLNLSLGGELATIRNPGIEFTYNLVKKGILNFTFNYLNISYNSATNNALAFEMLEALQPGNNYTWTVNLQRTLGRNLQLNINYDGRKPDGIRTIHVGSMQIRAFF